MKHQSPAINTTRRSDMYLPTNTNSDPTWTVVMASEDLAVPLVSGTSTGAPRDNTKAEEGTSDELRSATTEAIHDTYSVAESFQARRIEWFKPLSPDDEAWIREHYELAEIYDGKARLMVYCTDEEDSSKEEERHVTPGEIDSDARWVFMNGWCHCLAKALHRLTGYPMAAVGWHSTDRGRIDNHWGVLLPTGAVLDIEGPHDLDEWFMDRLSFSWGDREIRLHPDGYEPPRTVTAEEQGVFDCLGVTAEEYHASNPPQLSDHDLDAFAAALLAEWGRS